MVVPNPKDIVTKGLGDIRALRLDMEATLLDMMLGQWAGGSLADAAEAYSTPVFKLMQAVDGMAQAKSLGKEEEKIEEELYPADRKRRLDRKSGLLPRTNVHIREEIRADTRNS